MSLECTKYKVIDRGTLLGYADIFVPKWGVEIHGCSHHRKGNQEWVNLPSREYTDPQGEKKYAPIIRFRDKAHATAFGEACKEAIRNRPTENTQQIQQEQDLFS